MRYGHFDDKQREYVIDRPDTPLPWINYLGEVDYCGIISNNAGGYSFRLSPGHGRLLRYRFNAIPVDRPGRYIYIRDTDGDYWSVSWAPVCKPLDRHNVVCRHGLGYTTIASTYRDIAAEATYLVPEEDMLEIWRLSLRNGGATVRGLDIFTFAEFGVPEFARETDLQAYLFYWRTAFVNNAVSVQTRRAREDCTDAFFTSLAPIESYDTLRDAFIGPWRDEARPLAVERGRCSDSAGNGENACASLHTRVSLQPGQIWSTAYLLGSGHAETEAPRMRDRYTLDRIDEELEGIKGRWAARLAALSCTTPDHDTAVAVHTWAAYQTHVCFRWSRSASLIEAGGRDGLGYRDTLQDTLGAMHTSASKARERIVDLLRGQLSDGYALHSLQPLTLQTGRGDRPPAQCSDDHLWILLAVGAYLRETGDLAFLDRTVEFYDTGSATVYDHMARACRFSAGSRGANKLVLGLGADWNDSLGMRRTGAESVFTSMLYCRALAEWAEIARAIGRSGDIQETGGLRTEMIDIINTVAWDGDWYLRAVKANGQKIGSRENREGAIFANTQTWAVLSGVAAGDRAIRAMDSLREHLATEHGVRLCAPPYTDLDWDIGGMTLFPPGQKENGAIFCHPNPWVVIAESMLGRGDRAYEYFKAFLPHAMNDQAELRQVEPYVYCQFVKAPPDPGFGQGRNPWLTGTASWAFVAYTQHLLGIRPGLNGLVIDPCLPSAWSGVEVTRLFRGATYRITVAKPHGVCRGAVSLTVNGKPVNGNVVPTAAAGETVKVHAAMRGLGGGR